MSKVLHYSDSDVFAGTERHILDLAQALCVVGDKVTLACPSAGVLARKAEAAKLRILPIEKRGRFDIRAIFSLARGLRRRQFDVIHTHNGRTAFLATVAILFARCGRMVATQHFLQPAHVHHSGLAALFSRWMHRWIASRSHQIVAISKAVRDSILSRQAAPLDKVTIVLNGISDPSKDELTSRATTRAALGVPQEAFFIMTAARLETEKGINVLIQAMSQVVAQLTGARCIVAGEGAERQKLQGLIAEKNLTSSVTLAGFCPDVLSMVAAADLFVLPSHAEPFGLSILEAMALGVPVIACQAGGPAEIIEHEKSGLLVPPTRPAELAQAIIRFAREPELAQRLGKAGRHRFEQCFTAGRTAAHMQEVYRAGSAANV